MIRSDASKVRTYGAISARADRMTNTSDDRIFGVQSIFLNVPMIEQDNTDFVTNIERWLMR